jgi:hypothetical protein
MFKKFFNKRNQEILSKFDQEQIILYSFGPNFFGQESTRYKQLRGNGVLILTGDELYFEMYVPKRKYSFPIESIKSVDTVKSFLGKTRFTPLLRISFINYKGQEDSATWQLGDADVWLNRLQQIVEMKDK